MQEHLERNKVIVGWLSGLGIPIAIIFASWLITTSTEGSKLESEYVKIAIGVLARDAPPTPQEKVLKDWAIRLLDNKSPEKFSSKEKDALRDRPGVLDPTRTIRSVNPQIEAKGCQALEAGNAFYTKSQFSEAIEEYLKVQQFDKVGEGLCVASIYATIGTIFRLKADTLVTSDPPGAVRLLRLANEYNRAFATALMCQHGNCEYAKVFWRDWALETRL